MNDTQETTRFPCEEIISSIKASALESILAEPLTTSEDDPELIICPLTFESGSLTPTLEVRRLANNMLGMNIRTVTQIGNASALRNRFLASLRTALANDSELSKLGLSNLTIHMAQAAAHLYATSPNGWAEVIWATLEDTNLDIGRLTRVVRDPMDGEVWIHGILSIEENLAPKVEEMGNHLTDHLGKTLGKLKLLNNLIIPSNLPQTATQLDRPESYESDTNEISEEASDLTI